MTRRTMLTRTVAGSAVSAVSTAPVTGPALVPGVSPHDAEPGRYHFRHFADRLTPDGRPVPFTGTSAEFDIP
ncbi:hypothetical protein [Nocardia brevicatena]|uniref:hypothetical protein n=1 Tax=Nocardia brevicatena TaxID=37327 RepID=UPI0012FB4E40|nr:hypothetical protein [Nocardia brevicatena]